MTATDSSPALSCSRISHVPEYDEFFEKYLKPNVPVIIGPALVQSWSAVTNWTITDGHTASIINWNYLSNQYGHYEVTVADCSNVDSSGNQERHTGLFRDVVSLWLKGDGQSLYVKDWHLAKLVEGSDSHDAFYTTPDIFRDDWMNGWYSAHTDDDFRFVYVGGQGTFTPLHRDVYTSYSWSTNICGRKRWWLFPPDQTLHLFMDGRSMVPYDARTVDQEKFPNFHKTTPIVVEQNDGETIFVPSGWYHQVENLTQCISINHNWCNSVNLPSLYRSMCDKVVEVEQALEDVHDMLSSGSKNDNWRAEWVAIVQDVVKHDAGWNWLTFWRMVWHAVWLLDAPPPLARLDTKDNVRHPDSLFPQAPAILRPPSRFVLNQVEMCYEDFITRDRMENGGEVGSVVAAIHEVILTLKQQQAGVTDPGC
ncbi:Clavaminate synthase-like protein [Cristinia sonorae]|uniref:Clavaminate synthase-like protein n=1 Tax=Cristinia sonorae TaxID=1940300 RepID=A0A8K0XJU3_9AGAR|nr:Clavaminate synthase-like protein [Cristinia sonorae]